MEKSDLPVDDNNPLLVRLKEQCPVNMNFDRNGEYDDTELFKLFFDVELMSNLKMFTEMQETQQVVTFIVDINEIQVVI